MQALGMIPDFENETPSAGKRAKGIGAGSAAPLQMRSETISETPKQVYGDSVAAATALPSQSVEIPAGGDQGHEIDGSNDRCPADPIPPSDDDAFAAVKGKARLANVADVEPSLFAPIAPASQGEAEAPSAERVSPQADEAITGSADANTGGDDVDSSALRAGQEDRASNNGEGTRQSALPGKAYVLKPHCRTPSNCAGYGSTHCGSCKKAMAEGVSS
jgi:hypothetical protein